MNRLTKTFLVLLRLVIGFHFLFEGWSKIQTYEPVAPVEIPGPHQNAFQYGWPVGHPVKAAPPRKTAKGKNHWTSEAFLREATGPLAGVYRWLAGDPLLDQLEVRPPVDEGPADKMHERLPPGLEKEWRAYFDRFVDHYGLEGKQVERLEAALNQSKCQTVCWLLTGVKTVSRPAPAGNATLEDEVEMPKRIQEYKDKVKYLRDLQGIDRSATLRPNLDAEVKEVKAEVNRLRGELQSAVDEQTAAMKKSLRDTLALDPQKLKLGRVPEPVLPHWQDWDRLHWADFLLRWGIAIIGGCLLVGLFTRTACVLGALFLLTVFLSQPALPLLPATPEQEIHYQLIFKTLIEMMALLTLATTLSGRWVGVDGLLHCLFPWNWRSRPAVVKGSHNPVPTPEEKPAAGRPTPR
jgi:uncharacterized membrane protein YphA (DoxX/SURF4 family)